MTARVDPKKSLGQHFLHDRGVIGRIVDVSGIFPGDVVVEVGPGTGNLTEALLSAGAYVIAVEKDTRCIPGLNERFSDAVLDRHLIILEGDIRDHAVEHELFEEILSGIEQYKVVANIPYYITGLLLRYFLEGTHQPSQITFLVQDEVAKQVVGEHGKESILSLSVKIFGDPTYAGHVSRSHFDPPPKVDSAILLIQQIDRHRLSGVEKESFFRIMKAGFRSKRKMLVGNLSEGLSLSKDCVVAVFAELGIDTKIRAEDVPLTTWVLLAKSLSQ